MSTRYPLIGLALLPACSLLLSLDDIQPSPGSTDAGLDGTTADVVGADALEATSPVDAGAEAGFDAAPFCASLLPKPTYCDDFDEGFPAQTTWEGSYATDAAGPGTIDMLRWTSPPASLLFNAPGVSSGDAVSTAFYKTGLNAGVSFDLAFDMRFDTISTTVTIISVVFGSGTPYIVFLRVDPANGSVDERGPTNDAGVYTQIVSTFSEPVSPGEWTHIELNVPVAMCRLSVKKNGKYVVPERAGVPDCVTGPVTVVFGMDIAGPSSPFAVHYDNVVINVQ